MKHVVALMAMLLIAASGSLPVKAASVKPGDQITPDNAALVADLVSPGNYYLVRQGMRMNIIPTPAAGVATAIQGSDGKVFGAGRIER